MGKMGARSATWWGKSGDHWWSGDKVCDASGQNRQSAGDDDRRWPLMSWWDTGKLFDRKSFEQEAIIIRVLIFHWSLNFVHSSMLRWFNQFHLKFLIWKMILERPTFLDILVCCIVKIVPCLKACSLLPPLLVLATRLLRPTTWRCSYWMLSFLPSGFSLSLT